MVPHVPDPEAYNMLARVSGLVNVFQAELEITDILKSSGWEPEKSELPWEQNFL